MGRINPQCYRQNILTSEFFLDDKRFLGKIPLKPNPELRTAFFAADNRRRTWRSWWIAVQLDDWDSTFCPGY